MGKWVNNLELQIRKHDVGVTDQREKEVERESSIISFHESKNVSSSLKLTCKASQRNVTVIIQNEQKSSINFVVVDWAKGIVSSYTRIITSSLIYSYNLSQINVIE